MAAAAASPSSSPRLPSPPPIVEDQIGPSSPAMARCEDGDRPLSTAGAATGASRRIRPGTRAEDMSEGPALVELCEIDSAFQLTEHLKALYHHHTHPADSHSTAPITAAVARQLCTPPGGTAREIWLYELARFLIQKANAIVVQLFADDPPCTAQTCAEMRASEWQYLCAVHDPPKSCSAIDYCCHTLDWAAGSLTSSKMFPSRLNLGSGGVGGPHDQQMQLQLKEITNIFRRVYRIFAHAWFQHRDMFWRVEGQTGLYVFYKTVCDEYNLIQPENYTIPPEADGHEPDPASPEHNKPQIPTILSRPPSGIAQTDPANTTIARGNTTKRHAHSKEPSGSVTAVIQEEAEPEEEDTTQPKPGLDRSSTILHASSADSSLAELEEEEPEPEKEEPEPKKEQPEPEKEQPEPKKEEPEPEKEQPELEKEEARPEKEEAEPAEEAANDDEDEAPLPGIERTGTLNPEPDAPTVIEASEVPEAGDETTILVGESEGEMKPEEPATHADVEVSDQIGPPESPAGDAGQAEKTVAD